MQNDIDGVTKLMDETYYKHFPQLQATRKEYLRKLVTADMVRWSKNSIENMVKEVEDAVGNKKYLNIERKMAIYFWKNATPLACEIAKGLEGTVFRREEKKLQSYPNAMKSAILGAVIGMQKTLYRQCGNFPIQSTGASLTKGLMVAIWDKHRVPMMNVHDEIMIPSGYSDRHKEINETVQKHIESKKNVIKHLSMEWTTLKNWSEK